MPDDKIPSSVKFSKDVNAKITEAAKRTGLSKQNIIRICTAMGIEDLRRLGWDIPGHLSAAAEQTRAAESKKEIRILAREESEEA